VVFEAGLFGGALGMRRTFNALKTDDEKRDFLLRHP